MTDTSCITIFLVDNNQFLVTTAQKSVKLYPLSDNNGALYRVKAYYNGYLTLKNDLCPPSGL